MTDSPCDTGILRMLAVYQSERFDSLVMGQSQRSMGVSPMFKCLDTGETPVLLSSCPLILYIACTGRMSMSQQENSTHRQLQNSP